MREKVRGGEGRREGETWITVVFYKTLFMDLHFLLINYGSLVCCQDYAHFPFPLSLSVFNF